MGGYESSWAGFDWWWILPIAMMVLCIFMMGRGKCRTMCWPTSDSREGKGLDVPSDTATEILDKRYALGEIGKEEYEEKKRDISY